RKINGVHPGPSVAGTLPKSTSRLETALGGRMDAERWQRLKHHLSALLELSEAERSEALAHVELDAADKKALADMLAADASGDAFERAISRGVGQAEREIGNPSRIGSMVGAYRLIGQLGEGGMGDVYLAERADGRFEGAVAVKFLAMAGSRAATMFERERQILAQLQHPGIARLIDAGEDGEGHAYVVMEYVDGSRIDQYSMAHGLDIRSRLELIAQAADVVDHAHRMFVLHRDLKPAHLLVAGGSIKVLDFGVAALADPDTGMATATQSMSYTPRYAAPEQLLGEPNCPGTDVYSLALILYELLTGEHAFG